MLEQVALQHGTSVSEVVEEIAYAIAYGMADPDPAARAFWTSIPRQGAVPTPEEVIAHTARYILAGSPRRFQNKEGA